MELIIAANWKMHKTIAEAAAFCREIIGCAEKFSGAEVIICPPFTALQTLRDGLKDRSIKLGAQNMHWEEGGAFTGEIGPFMLQDLGVEYVIIGHSERRRLMGEDNTAVRRKLQAALRNGLRPILCVGETDAERTRGETDEVLGNQLRKALGGLALNGSGIVIAYEPVWAIGTGKAASPEDAEKAAAYILHEAEACLGCGDALPVQYGGSVNQDNIGDYVSLPSVSGALVGGASLEARSFSKLIQAAREAL